MSDYGFLWVICCHFCSLKYRKWRSIVVNARTIIIMVGFLESPLERVTPSKKEVYPTNRRSINQDAKCFCELNLSLRSIIWKMISLTIARSSTRSCSRTAFFPPWDIPLRIPYKSLILFTIAFLRSSCVVSMRAVPSATAAVIDRLSGLRVRSHLRPAFVQ